MCRLTIYSWLQSSCSLGYSGVNSNTGYSTATPDFSDAQPVVVVDLTTDPGSRAALFDILVDWQTARDLCRCERVQTTINISYSVYHDHRYRGLIYRRVTGCDTYHGNLG